jgi:hypothetical protein
VTDDELLRRFVATFGAFDDLLASRQLIGTGNIHPLVLEPWSEWGFAQWRPIAQPTPREALKAVYSFIPGKFPPLYERLILSYRWYEVDVGPLRLLSSLPPRLDGLVDSITKDQGLFATLTSAGFVQFGKGADVDYDPVCFDVSSYAGDDCRVVKFDHEEILMHGRLVEVAELAPSFHALVDRLLTEGEEELGRRSSGFLNEYMAYADSVARGAADDSNLAAAEELNQLVRVNPERAWPLIKEAVRLSPNDRVLAFVAAGPLEDLIRLHARQFIDRIEAAASSDNRFRWALSGVWVSDLPADLDTRIERIIGPGPRL